MSARSALRPWLPMLFILGLVFSVVGVLATPAKVAAQTELIAELSGSAEVPGPGDEDGAGFASVLIHPEEGEVCAFIDVVDIASATAAHIHAGAEGVAGDIVVTLPTPDEEGFAEACVTGLDSTLLQAIVDAPASYYVNVHNAEFPAGAVRGQLQEAPPPPVELFAELSGAAEVPGPGDPDGAGFASVAFFLEDGEVCAFIEVVDIATPMAAHIHAGAEGVAGDIVITLPTPNEEGIGEGCVTGLDSTLLQAIVDAPASYYVNVHNAEFPAGAVRGQLSTEPPEPPACEPGELCDGTLPPGTYTYTGFATDVTFTTTTEWIASLLDVPALTLIDFELGGGVFAFPFTGGVFADPCDFDSGTTIGDSPADVMTWLTGRDFLATSSPGEVTYGGASGLQVDVSAVTVPPDCSDPPWVLLFTLPVVGDFHFEEGSVARVVALEVGGETIILIAEAFPGSDAAAFLDRAQAVLDSMVWSLGGDGGATPPPASPSPSPGTLPDTAQPVLEASTVVGAAPLVGFAWLSVAVLLLVIRRVRSAA